MIATQQFLTCLSPWAYLWQFQFTSPSKRQEFTRSWKACLSKSTLCLALTKIPWSGKRFRNLFWKQQIKSFKAMTKKSLNWSPTCSSNLSLTEFKKCYWDLRQPRLTWLSSNRKTHQSTLCLIKSKYRMPPTWNKFWNKSGWVFTVMRPFLSGSSTGSPPTTLRCPFWSNSKYRAWIMSFKYRRCLNLCFWI